jgi:hypothetical protein
MTFALDVGFPALKVRRQQCDQFGLFLATGRAIQPFNKFSTIFFADDVIPIQRLA